MLIILKKEYENQSKTNTETVKLISTINGDLDATGAIQADITDGKTLRHTVLIKKLVRGKRAHLERMKQVWAIGSQSCQKSSTNIFCHKLSYIDTLILHLS